jgi:putative FmdB family regulatory protein
MPIYEYKCRKCGSAFEHLARTTTEPAPKCPKCGAPKPEKQLSVFSASVAGSSPSLPCADGACPSSGGCASGGCAMGGCPHM